MQCPQAIARDLQHLVVVSQNALAGLSITPVSVSHHQSVLGYHHQVLELTGDGLWALHAAADYRWT